MTRIPFFSRLKEIELRNFALSCRKNEHAKIEARIAQLKRENAACAGWGAAIAARNEEIRALEAAKQGGGVV